MPLLFLCRIKSTVADLQSEVEEAVDQIQSALGNNEAVMERQASHQQAGPRLVMRDGVHLFDPTASHHKVLAQRGVATTAAGTSSLATPFGKSKQALLSLGSMGHTKWSCLWADPMVFLTRVALSMHCL